MIVIRLIRISGVAGILAFLFHLSREASRARGNDDLPGMLWAIGVLGVLFVLRAVALEILPSRASATEKDVMWGLALGVAVTILVRL
ncbi:MAG TPA: hypothetical protein VEC57_01795 [Candidatus Limnocylindrales bacterium]|nr:hypothetical protein [Candidatus Limnocylindrales bacterium]